MFSSSVLCKDKPDSVLTRLKEEVQKYVNHVLQGFQNKPLLGSRGDLTKGESERAEDRCCAGNCASEELQKPPVAFPADRLETAQKSGAT